VSEHIALWVTGAMGWFGYAGLGFLMALESMVAPVPSELVMPFAGFLVDQGRFTLLGGIAASSLGTFVGSMVGYYMGKYGGYPVVEHFGRFLLLDRGHLEMTARWFEKRGDVTVFVSRFIPIVRHFISIPAGVANMSLPRFIVFTVIGGTMWNTFLLLVGIRLNQRWEIVHHYSHHIDIVVAVLIVIVGIWWAWKQIAHRRQKPPEIR